MKSTVSRVRQIANWLVLGMLKGASGSRREWALGMSAEVDAIESDWAALWFALGCSAALLRARGYIAFVRKGLAGLVFGWAGVKAYLAIWSMGYTGVEIGDGLPDWLGAAALLAALGYGCAGLSLGCGRYRLMALGFSGALGINGVLYASAMFGQGAPGFFLMAVALEDYFIWTCALGGFVGLWRLETKREEAAS